MSTLLPVVYCFFYRNISNNVYLACIRDNCLLNCMLLNCILKPLCNQFGCSCSWSAQPSAQCRCTTIEKQIQPFTLLLFWMSWILRGQYISWAPHRKSQSFWYFESVDQLFKFQKDKNQAGDFSSLLFKLKATGKFHTLTTSCVFYVVCL